VKDLNSALAEISAIRSQLALAAEFHGYGPMTVAATGVLALAAAAFQERILPGAGHDVTKFVEVWSAIAVIAAVLVGIEMTIRTRMVHSGQAQEMLAHAIEQLIPSGIAGLLITVVLLRNAPEAAWMLPGLWQILLSVGACASAWFLPRPILLVGGWYLVTGLICLSASAGRHVPSPWTMGLPFFGGQMLTAAIFQWSESRIDGKVIEE
jgi:hypothetical protein